MQQLIQLTGKSLATVYRHLSRLRLKTSLDWRTTGDGRIIISFDDGLLNKPDQSVGFPGLTDSSGENSYNQDSFQPAHYFPPRILGYLSYEEYQIE
jgi:hypothetical protein